MARCWGHHRHPGENSGADGGGADGGGAVFARPKPLRNYFGDTSPPWRLGWSWKLARLLQ